MERIGLSTTPPLQSISCDRATGQFVAPCSPGAPGGSSPGDATRCAHPRRVQRGQRDGRRTAGREQHKSSNPAALWGGVVHHRPQGDARAEHVASGCNRQRGASVATRVRPGKNGIRICTSSRITCGRFRRACARQCAAVESSADHSIESARSDCQALAPLRARGRRRSAGVAACGAIDGDGGSGSARNCTSDAAGGFPAANGRQE